MNSIGIHYIWDVHHISSSLISVVDPVKTLLDSIIASTQLTIEGENFKQFSPVGVTGLYLLSESHISIHTWPEHGYAAIDLFSCIPVDPSSIQNVITDILGDDVIISEQVIQRGMALTMDKGVL